MGAEWKKKKHESARTSQPPRRGELTRILASVDLMPVMPPIIGDDASLTSPTCFEACRAVILLAAALAETFTSEPDLAVIRAFTGQSLAH